MCQKNSQRLEVPTGGGDKVQGSVDQGSQQVCLSWCPKGEAFRDSELFFPRFSREFPGIFLGNPGEIPETPSQMWAGLGVAMVPSWLKGLHIEREREKKKEKSQTYDHNHHTIRTSWITLHHFISLKNKLV